MSNAQLWKVTADHPFAGRLDADGLSRDDADAVARALAEAGLENIQVTEDNGLTEYTITAPDRMPDVFAFLNRPAKLRSNAGKRGSAEWKQHWDGRGKRRR
jgi:hypothetical protein